MSGRLPWEHPFQPDPLTPTACVICALHPQWHTPRPILFDGEEERLARVVWHVSEDWGTIDLNAEDRAFGDSEPFMQLARAIIKRLRGEA